VTLSAGSSSWNRKGHTRCKVPYAKEISDLLQVSEFTVLRMDYSRDLPYIQQRSGKRKKIIRFDPVTVERWLEIRAKKVV
jgi:hypothetical protein